MPPLPLRETALPCKPINMSKRYPNSLLRVFKCFVFHMVPICIFAKELIYAFEILWPPNHTNHTASITSACAFFTDFGFPHLVFPLRKCRISQIQNNTSKHTDLTEIVSLVSSSLPSFSDKKKSMSTIYRLLTLLRCNIE